MIAGSQTLFRYFNSKTLFFSSWLEYNPTMCVSECVKLRMLCALVIAGDVRLAAQVVAEFGVSVRGFVLDVAASDQGVRLLA